VREAAPAPQKVAAFLQMLQPSANSSPGSGCGVLSLQAERSPGSCLALGPAGQWASVFSSRMRATPEGSPWHSCGRVEGRGSQDERFKRK
jgi:hypothetical protein